MSVYLIIPSLPCSYVKFGKTGKTDDTNVVEYLYHRYRTPYGKGLIAYIWKCPNDYNKTETSVIARFVSYKSHGDELFFGEKISQLIFDYCCKHINKKYTRYHNKITTISYHFQYIVIESQYEHNVAINTSKNNAVRNINMGDVKIDFHKADTKITSVQTFVVEDTSNNDTNIQNVISEFYIIDDLENEIKHDYDDNSSNGALGNLNISVRKNHTSIRIDRKHMKGYRAALRDRGIEINHKSYDNGYIKSKDEINDKQNESWSWGCTIS